MNREFHRIVRFLATGALNAGFGYACYAGFILAGAPLWLAVSGTTALAFLFNFMSYGRLVFGSTSHVLVPRFLLFYAALGGLNFALLRLLALAGLGPLIAQAVLLPVLAIAGYAGMRGFVFRLPPAALPQEGA